MTDIELANKQVDMQAKLIAEMEITIGLQSELIKELQESNESYAKAVATMQINRAKH